MHGSCSNGQRCVLTNNGYQKTCVSGEYIFMMITIMIMITIIASAGISPRGEEAPS